MIFLFIKGEKGTNDGKVRLIQFRCMACATMENPIPRIIYSFAFRTHAVFQTCFEEFAEDAILSWRGCAKTTESADKLCVIVVIGHNSYSRKV